MVHFRKNIHVYYDFFAAAKYHNINTAAIILGVNESTVCRSIQRLERLENTKLVITGRNGIELTSAGEKLYGLLLLKFVELE